ncbi:delta-class carbonic anhydrase [Chachezhania antarctica]|uniref:delta-class carbonic anhydrase n=1 Tax=Chachezhania antarctica TaxID=2340860 RepID=UPI000EB529D6|nr:delta-class carbonic anhydrase [Chachezhania antarctica]|tara:strand:+ start:4410 stop:5195 length:786 start_codon:yes stop_codon:yes gene_type:complete
MIRMLIAFLVALPLALPAQAAQICRGYGPQTPRDISMPKGRNTQSFPMAPARTDMNLCNIHTHTNAEHRGPGFSVSAGDGPHGGWKCNETENLTAQELEDPAHGRGAFKGVKPGDTIEVHWVFSSCDVTPGPGLGSCLSKACANPVLRVESQVFLVVNDDRAEDFMDYVHQGHMSNGRPQPRALPEVTGPPVVFRGSTTGTSYNHAICSPLQVTWSVRPMCLKVNYRSLLNWVVNGNVFEEDHSHGVRPLVTSLELLAPIE